MKKILISGGQGEFAKELNKCNTLYKIVSPPKEEMNVKNIDDLEYYMSSEKPDYFIHAGALTRPMIIHEGSPDESISVNIIGTANVVLTCIKYDIKLIYLSEQTLYF